MSAKTIKNIWMTLLIIATFMLIIGIGVTNWWYLSTALALALVVRIFGYQTLFGEYDQKRQAKRKQYLAARRAVDESAKG